MPQPNVQQMMKQVQKMQRDMAAAQEKLKTEELEVTLILATHAQDLMRRAGFTLVSHDIDASDEHAMTVSVSNA